MRRIDVDTIGTGALAEDVLIQSAHADPVAGRDVNGEICAQPGRARAASSPAKTPGNRDPPPGWGVFDPAGTQVGKLAATYLQPGCRAPRLRVRAGRHALHERGRVPGLRHQQRPTDPVVPALRPASPGLPGAYPDTDDDLTNFCKLATDLGTAGAVAVDDQGRVYVAAVAGLRIDALLAAVPDRPRRGRRLRPHRCDRRAARRRGPARDLRDLAATGMLTFSGLAIGAERQPLRGQRLHRPHRRVRPRRRPRAAAPRARRDRASRSPTGHPQGIAFGADGTLYYADLDLRGRFPTPDPAQRQGVAHPLRRGGDPLPPEVVRAGPRVPRRRHDLPGRSRGDDPPPLEWPTLAGGPERQFFNPTRRRSPRRPRRVDRALAVPDRTRSSRRRPR